MKSLRLPTRLSIRTVLWGANALVLLLPIGAFGALRIYQTLLLRTTERQLITQAVVVGEIYRERIGLGETNPRPPEATRFRYTPIDPQIDLGYQVDPPLDLHTPCTPEDPVHASIAKDLEPILRRMQIRNLSSMRIIDTRGCVVSTTRSEANVDLSQAPEVRVALAGTYAAFARARISDEPLAPLGSIQRRGRARVFIALPIFADGKVVGVVRASRTGLDAISSLWEQRRGLFAALLLCGAGVLLVVLIGTRAISRPLRRLTNHARRLAKGEDSPSFKLPTFATQEVAVLGEVLDDTTAALRSRGEAIAEYARNVSHELKTPITAIIGAAELMQDSNGSSTATSTPTASMNAVQRQRFLSNIIADATRMERLVQRLLLLTRLENPAAHADRSEALDVHQCLQEIVERDSQIQLHIEAPMGTAPINENHFRSVVGNLIDNALTHGGDGPVSVHVRAADDFLLIEVRNGGPNIRPEHLPRLFEPFFTTQRDTGGTGLGLPIVKAIAEGRGGSVSVHSGGGETVFKVRL